MGCRPADSGAIRELGRAVGMPPSGLAVRDLWTAADSLPHRAMAGVRA
jgi:hypothetical protein